MLWEQNNIFRKQDNMLWEQNIFFVGTRYYIEGTRYIFSNMALISHRSNFFFYAK